MIDESSEGEADDDLDVEGGGVDEGDIGRVVGDVLIVRNSDDGERKESNQEIHKAVSTLRPRSLTSLPNIKIHFFGS
jgi:hypothetical protein